MMLSLGPFCMQGTPAIGPRAGVGLMGEQGKSWGWSLLLLATAISYYVQISPPMHNETKNKGQLSLMWGGKSILFV